MVSYEKHPRFSKQLKKLLKKFRSLNDDLLILQKAGIELFHINKIDNNSVELIQKLNSEYLQIYKVIKFACKSLKGKGVRSGIRVIYAFYPRKQHIEYLEIYYKEKDDTDMDYIFVKEYFANNR